MDKHILEKRKQIRDKQYKISYSKYGEIFNEFESRLKSDNIEEELDKSINQVKKIATLRLNEIIHE